MSVGEFCGPDYWKKRWSNSEICFHKEDVHPMLQKYLNKLTDENNNSKIFFPLCGKAVDMAWLASMGHEIVGVDLAQKAIEQFFSENKIPHTIVDSGEFRLYKSEDGRIKLYLGDFFKFNAQYEGKFECVWDRACIVALTSKIRAQYAAHIQTLLADGFKYLLDVFEFDQSLFKGPPHSVSLNELNNLYGTKCAIEQLDSFFIQSPQPLFPEQFVANPPYEKVYLLTNRAD